MKNLIFCSTNEGKKKFIKESFEKLGLDIDFQIIDFEVDEIQNLDNKEVAKHKVLQVYEKIKKPCFAIDSGIFIDTLNGFPGSYAKMVLETIGINGIIKLLSNETNRYFETHNCLAYYDGINLKTFSEKIKGNISENIYLKLNNDYSWSELDKIFIPEGYEKTLAEMNNQEYLKWNESIQKGYLMSFVRRFKSSYK